MHLHARQLNWVSEFGKGHLRQAARFRCGPCLRVHPRLHDTMVFDMNFLTMGVTDPMTPRAARSRGSHSNPKAQMKSTVDQGVLPCWSIVTTTRRFGA